MGKNREIPAIAKELAGNEKVRILFVCLGNICRSPAAEGVMRSLVEERGQADRFEIDPRVYMADMPENCPTAVCVSMPFSEAIISLITVVRYVPPTMTISIL